MSDLYYIYAVVAPTANVAAAPPGVDGGPVALVPEGDVAALVSRVDTAYARGLDDRLTDVAWLGPRATAHDAVLTWASDSGPVVPLPLLSLFRSDEAVRAMLRERSDELRALLAQVGRGREYGVRVFRIDEELREALAALSPTVAELARDVAAATSPGQRYLLGRKLDAAKKDELRRVSEDVAARALERLLSQSLASAQDPLPNSLGEHAGVAVLNASFLVAHDRIDDFRATVTGLVREYEGRGFRFEFTGPWPPYHFARSGVTGGRDASVMS